MLSSESASAPPTDAYPLSSAPARCRAFFVPRSASCCDRSVLAGAGRSMKSKTISVLVLCCVGSSKPACIMSLMVPWPRSAELPRPSDRKRKSPQDPGPDSPRTITHRGGVSADDAKGGLVQWSGNVEAIHVFLEAAREAKTGAGTYPRDPARAASVGKFLADARLPSASASPAPTAAPGVEPLQQTSNVKRPRRTSTAPSASATPRKTLPKMPPPSPTSALTPPSAHATTKIKPSKRPCPSDDQSDCASDEEGIVGWKNSCMIDGGRPRPTAAPKPKRMPIPPENREMRRVKPTGDARSMLQALLLQWWKRLPRSWLDASRNGAPCVVDSSMAFVGILFGTDVAYCMDALVLGESLKRQGTRHPYVLLITEEVPRPWRGVLEKVGWELREVPYLHGEHLCTKAAKKRFAGVFTKLHALNLCEFEKIVLLDLDLLVRKNVDHLLQRTRIPCATRRHASGDCKDQEEMLTSSFFNRQGHLVCGINAGVMIMRPSRVEFDLLMQKFGSTCEHGSRPLASNMPEQDFLSQHLGRTWYHLHVWYNFQLHQLAYTDRKGLERCQRLSTDYKRDVSIVHFSSKVKPRDFFIRSEYSGKLCYAKEDVRKFAEDVLLPEYLKGMQSGHHSAVFKVKEPEAARRLEEQVQAQLRAATFQSTYEWFDHWYSLVRGLPSSVSWSPWPLLRAPGGSDPLDIAWFWCRDRLLLL